MTLKSILAAAALAGCATYAAVAATATASPTAPIAGPAGTSIVGSWNASFGPGAPPFAMYTFHADGTMAEADNPGFDPNFGGDALSPGIGAWEASPLAGVDARAKYQKLAYDTTGTLTLIYTSTIQMRTSQAGVIGGVIDIEIATPDGTVVNSIPNLVFTASPIEPF